MNAPRVDFFLVNFKSLFVRIFGFGWWSKKNYWRIFKLKNLATLDIIISFFTNSIENFDRITRIIPEGSIIFKFMVVNFIYNLKYNFTTKHAHRQIGCFISYIIRHYILYYLYGEFLLYR